MGSILSITEFYKIKLNAPVKNVRVSWGSVRKDQSAVFLSIWQDEIHRDNPRDPSSDTWVDVLWSEEKWSQITDAKVGRNERVTHIDLIKSGIPGFALIKIAKDIKVKPREMKEFNSEYLISIKNNFRDTGNGLLQVQLGEKVPVELLTSTAL